MRNDRLERLDACAFIVREAHSSNDFQGVKISQNAISPDLKLIESQSMAQMIHNDQVYIGSKRKVCANVTIKL